MAAVTEKWTVGQQVLIYDVNSKAPMPGVVEKVGRTRVHVYHEGYRRTYSFDKETGREGGKYDHSRIKSLEQAADDDALKAAVARLKELGVQFSDYGRPRYATAVLLEMIALLEGHTHD